MDDFLLDSPKSSYDCNSISDLEQQLSHLREAKVAPNKAHRLSATFSFPATVVFDVPEPNNDAADANQNLDPASASANAEAAINGVTASPTSEIRAKDTIMNQPNDDPVLQRAVAKLIITSLGNADSSSWSVREMSRSTTGWTFQYICKNSTQAWLRQNSKNAAKVLVAESSGKDGQDPVNLARPAFDCRGSVTIAFLKNSRMITVKFEHTPIHKTVAELAEIFKPPPPPTRAVGVARKDRESKKRKKPADNSGENAEESTSTKKRRKKTTNPDDPTSEGQPPKPKKPHPSKSQRRGSAAPVAADASEDPVLNLSPSETARRREEATRKLSENGIDPATLSQEQFDIFANQSPELQTESLAMLIKYGAERLRIVHPNKDDDSSSPAQANGGASDGSGKKKKSRRRQQHESGITKVKKTRGGCQACRAKKTKCSKAKPECEECVRAGIECYYPPEQKRKPIRKPDDVAKDDEPAELVNATDSAELVDAIEPAELLNASEPPAAGPESAAPADAIESVAMSEPTPEITHEEEVSDLGSPGFDSSHPAPPATIPQQTDASDFQEASHDSHDLYEPGAGSLSYPQAVQDDMAAGMDYSAYSSQLGQQQATQNGMAYPQQSQQTSNTSYPDQLNTPPGPAPEPAQAVQPPVQSTHSKPARGSAARRSLPSGAGLSQNGYSNPVDTGDGSAWQAANASASTAQTYTASSPPRQSKAGRQTAMPLPARAYDASQQEALAAAATLSHAALRLAQPSPTTRTVSPFQTATQAAAQAARAKSRQGQRTQSRTTASPFQQASTKPAAVDTAVMYNTSSTTTEPSNLPNYDQYPRYNVATSQNGQASSRGAYDSYAQQTNTNNMSASYQGYDAYNARSQPSAASPLAAPVTQGLTASYTKTAAPSTRSWTNSPGHRSTNSYGTNNAAGSANSTYNAHASSTQQQPPNLQSLNVRPQTTARASRTNTPSSYNAQQQRTQQSRHQQQQQQQTYNSYSAQPQGSSGQQSSHQQQQQQQDWYSFGSGNTAKPGYGSSSRDADYGQPSQHRPAVMNISGSTYQSLGDQDLYDIFRAPPAH